MTITHALSNALSGLSASSRAADIVASNVANAMTEGYGRRDVELSARSIGGNASGVQVIGITRATDPVTTGARRVADGQVELENTRIEFMDALSRSIGQVDEANSLTGLTVGFETALIEAANNPESDAHLNNVASSAAALTSRVNAVADTIAELRMQADNDIAKTVESLQSDLDRLVQLNVKIVEQASAGHDASALVDQRHALINQVSEIVPVKEVLRENGMVSLVTLGGAILLDSKAAELGFSQVPTITPDMSVSTGVLSGLTINGQPVSTDAESGAIAGGALAGLFEIRDVLAPQAQENIDAFARDLVIRFETPLVDPSLNVGDPGLFTDRGAAFDPLLEVGLANNLTMNAAVDPSNGGENWRFRDGLGAASEGNAGDSTILQNMVNALQSRVETASGGFSAMGRTVTGLSADLYSLTESRKLAFDSDLTFVKAQQAALISIEAERGVDTDHEMQELLLIEQSYAANAKVIETIDTLLDTLMRSV